MPASSSMDSSVPAPDSKGRNLPVISDHQLLRRIGRGSYGEVWLAKNVLGTRRAVKVVYRGDFESSRPYEREFQGIQQCEPVSRSHQSLVDVLQIGQGETGDYFYYVMELAEVPRHFPWLRAILLSN